MTVGRQRKQSKYEAMRYYYQAEHWPIEEMCRLLKVSRAGYYKWLRHEKTAEEAENQQIVEWIQTNAERYKHTLGYRRMTGYINREHNKDYGEKRIYRLMRKLGLKSVIRPKKAKYLYSKPEITAENILKRDFNAERPNEKWATDVTEMKWYEGAKVHKVYLSAILDLYDRSVISYVCSRRNDNQLVYDTFEKAIEANPEAKPLFHSDRGFQYTSKAFRSKLERQGMTQSMSRVGRCIDNGPTEGFWGIIKSEMYYLESFASEEELIHSIEEFIEYYNNGRYQARYDYHAPLEIRAAAMRAETATPYPIPQNHRIEKFKSRYAS